MPTNEDGEFELVLGNRQLLSVFFIVVILLGIFFTMGYIVGQHSTPLVTADNTPKSQPTKPIVVDSPREPEPESSNREPVKSSEPPPKTKPEPIRTAPQQPAEPEAPKAAKKSPPPEKKEPAPPPAAATGAPSGTYLQLAATTKREADIMVDVLRQKKFTAITSQVPDKPDLFRVLVGPISEAQVNKTKTDLQSAGFPGDKSIKRTF